MLGIVIGVALLVTLVSLGQGLEDSITAQFETLGTDKIYIYPGSNVVSATVSDLYFSEKEKDAIGKVSGVKYVAVMVYKIARVEHDDEVKYTQVMGMPLDETREVFKTVHNMEVVEGRDLKNGDKSKAVMGISLTEDKTVFAKGIPVGSKMLIEGQEFEIIGSLDRIGNPDDDSMLIIPLDTAKTLFNQEGKYNFLLAQVDEGASPKVVAAKIKKELRSMRGLDEGDEDFSVQTTDDLMDSFSTILSVVQAVVLGLALISLIVGAIGIMNTMYTAIIERTRQIGVMKAIGATNFNIAFIFQVESGLLGFAGGVVGVLIGMGIGKLVEVVAHYANITFFNISFPWWLLLGALAFSTIVGILSGLFPSLQAAKMKPVDALRYE
jgi:putative ABC transport system permease protein